MATMSVVAVGVVALVVVSAGLASAEVTASVTIRVEAPGASHAFEFSGGYNTSAGGVSFTETLAHGESYVMSDLDTSPGATVLVDQVLEVEPLLWRLVGISCVEDSPFPFVASGDVDYYGDAESGQLSVLPAPGQHIVCTFTNDDVAGTFTFATEVDAGNSNQEAPGWDPGQLFTYDTRLSGTPTTVQLGDGGWRTDTALPVPWQYVVHQRRVPGWTTEVDCTGSATWWPVVEEEGLSVGADFEDGETLYCTFTNTYVVSSLTIEVDAPDDPGQPFTFLGSSDDAGAGDPTTSTGTFESTLRHGETHTQYLTVGEAIHVAVTETMPPGWSVSDISCVELVDVPLLGTAEIPYDPAWVDLEGAIVELYPDAGTNLKCTFGNDYRAGRLSFGPRVVSGDTSQSFTYEARLDDDVTVELTDGEEHVADLVTVPYQYAVVQKAQPGWDTTVDCIGGTIAASGTESDGDTFVHIEIDEDETADCTFENTYVNRPPVADAGGPYEVDEGSSLHLDGSGSFDLDGDVVTHEWDLDGDGEFDDASGPTPSLLLPDGPAEHVVALRVTDPLGEFDTDTATIVVNNVAPSVATPVVAPAPSDEGEAVTAGATFSDPAGDHDTHTCTVDYGDGDGPVEGDVAGDTCTGPSHLYLDDGEYTVTVTVTDDDGGEGRSSVGHVVRNVPPEVSVDPDAQTVQYSDRIADVTITATDVAADVLHATLDAPAMLSLSPEGCLPDGVRHTCAWTLSGPVRLPAGTHELTLEVTDDDGGSTTATITLTVLHEDAVVSFGTDNPVAVPVTDDGSDESEPFTLLARVREAPETGDAAAPGDINLAEVNLTLEPVGPGTPIGPVPCVPTASVTPFDYAAALEVECAVAGIPVNAYVATVTIGGDHYRGATDEDVVVVYDPSLGFTTGGGWFAWPGTGERTTFGYTMSYNKKATNARGSMVVIRRTADGERYRLKSNAISGLALGETPDMGWASFLGKATYVEPGMDEAEGNHTFMAYVEDRGEPGAGGDRFWIEVLDKDGSPVGLSMDRPADVNAAELGGGNIVVPHAPGKGVR